MKTVTLLADEDFILDPKRAVAALQESRCGAVLLTNPHNPSGALTPRDSLLEIVQRSSQLGATVVIDEAFIDYAEHESIMDIAQRNEHAIVLRSVTKFYAMPGLRVGYAVAEPAVARRIAAFLPSWPVSTVALEAAARALHDAPYDRRTLEQNARESSIFCAALSALGFRVLPSVANFMLIELPFEWGSCAAVCHQLIEEFGIIVRNCDDYQGLTNERFIRVAVRDGRDNARLIAALEALRGSKSELTPGTFNSPR